MQANLLPFKLNNSELLTNTTVNRMNKSALTDTVTCFLRWKSMELLFLNTRNLNPGVTSIPGGLWKANRAGRTPEVETH